MAAWNCIKTIEPPDLYIKLQVTIATVLMLVMHQAPLADD